VLSSSTAVGRPRGPRAKKPEVLLIEINEENRAVLRQMLAMLQERLLTSEREIPRRPRHIHLTRIARNVVETLLTQNPQKLLIDPDDFARRGVIFFLDDSCWAWIQKEKAQRAYALELERQRYKYYRRPPPGQQYYASSRYNYGDPNGY
jgi:hypothetical protein